MHYMLVGPILRCKIVRHSETAMSCLEPLPGRRRRAPLSADRQERPFGPQGP